MPEIAARGHLDCSSAADSCVTTMRTRFEWSSRSLIALTTVCTGIISALAASSLSIMAAKETLAANIQDRLALESQRRADKFANLIHELRGDVSLLADVPPIQGLIRTRHHRGMDPLDGSSAALWQSRLSSIFEGILLAKPHYLQVRYIGLADGGMELVRVERDVSTDRVTRAPRLQRKGDQAYVTDAAALPDGGMYLSPIDLNREYGRIQFPATPVLRAAVPVYDEQSGGVFGVLVVNLRADYFFDALHSMKSESISLALTNSDGEYLIHPTDAETFAFEFGRTNNAAADFPLLDTVLRSGISAGLRDDATQQFIDLRRVNYGTDQSLGMVMTVSTDALSTFSKRVAGQLVVTLVIICMLCALFALLVAHRIAHPINQLSTAFATWTPGDEVPPLPQSSYGEARTLAGVLRSVFTTLAHRNRELEATNRELDQFAYIASHDLQEPVRTVTSFAEMLRDDAGNQLSPRSEKGLSFMLQSCARMRTLIQGLLEYSRIGHHAAAVPVNLNTVVTSALKELSAGIHRQSAEVQITTPLPTLRLFEDEVRMLFRHLIANAIKFCPDGRTPRVTVRAEPTSNGACRILVQDNGIGIPESQRDRVFTIFQRAVGRDDFAGTGIGLAHCRKIVDLHHGRIWIHASSPSGTTLAVELVEVDA